MSAGPGGPTHERVAYQNGPERANCMTSDRGQDLGAVVRHRDRVLEVGRERAVARHDRPALGLDLDLVAAERQHRLDREADPGLELQPAGSGPVVRDLRLLVHLGPDPMADELADDAVAV